jgi:transposase
MNMTQAESQNVDEFYADLKIQCEKCRFTNQDERIIDQIIKGITNTDAKKELIADEKLTLDQCLQTARKHEANEKQFKNFQSSTASVNAVRAQRGKEKKFYKNCYFCGKDHVNGECPAYGSTCHSC